MTPYGGGYLPPGTPGPRTAVGTLECETCGRMATITATTELGMTSWSPEECRWCGSPWPDDAQLDFDRDDRSDIDY